MGEFPGIDVAEGSHNKWGLLDVHYDMLGLVICENLLTYETEVSRSAHQLLAQPHIVEEVKQNRRPVDPVAKGNIKCLET